MIQSLAGLSVEDDSSQSLISKSSNPEGSDLRETEPPGQEEPLTGQTAQQGFSQSEQLSDSRDSEQGSVWSSLVKTPLQSSQSHNAQNRPLTRSARKGGSFNQPL